jgi:propionyl-CoA carboxylase alpha chain
MVPLFRRLLIANRGEIACRIIRTARRLGIETVAVASNVDARALHAREADIVVPLPGSTAAETYLRADLILAAARDTGAEAIHPGYGFLSERASFAEAVEAAGLAFVGPTARSIAAMGDKIESKRLAAAAGVPTVPGEHNLIPDAEAAITVARRIGYPVMIKATAGGGGKGMRLAANDAEVREGFAAAGNEARGAFGDDRLFIEKAIVRPRHIEIQVLGDSHGNVVHLGERECSIQRRHQKVFEEAPSPFLDATTRAEMGAKAVALAQAVDYRSAGTVEFIVDQDKNFYFLEMNTRLQVEHPVTEEVTGLDLVELMLRVAAGEALPFRQEDIQLTGASIEARVYAEDPVRGFLPSTGRLRRYGPPTGPGVRIDTGVDEGAEISMFYDPMIAKLICTGETREEAVTLMAKALDGFVVRGVSHNLDFLAAILAKPAFRQGALSTDFIATEFPSGFSPNHPEAAVTDQMVVIAAVAQFLTLPRPAGEATVALIGEARDSERRVQVVPCERGFTAALDGGTHLVETSWRPGQIKFDSTIDGRPVVAQLDRTGVDWRVRMGGAALDVRIVSAVTAALARLMPAKPAPDLSRFLLSPMPGLLVSLSVVEGQAVKAGEALAVVEAMKMENILRAERDATVLKVAAAKGDSLAVDQVILEFT